MGDPLYTQTLLDFYDLFKGIVQESVFQDSLFQKSFKEAFDVFSTIEAETRILLPLCCPRSLTGY